MKQNQHTVDQIIAKLRHANVKLRQEKNVPKICKLSETTEQLCHRWCQTYSGDTHPEMAKRLKALQKDNSPLKKLVVDPGLGHEDSQGGRPEILVSLERRRQTVEAPRRRLRPERVSERMTVMAGDREAWIRNIEK